MDFLNHWTNSSICWISRSPLEQEVPMISSISLRSPRKTCGLFDTGLAGDAEHIASKQQIAPTNVLTEFDLGGHDSSISFPNLTEFDTLNEGALGSFTKDSQVQSVSAPDGDNWDLLDDLSADPLGDESLDAFINLDKYLTGNSFFDEDGNFVQDPEEVKPVINIPTIEDIDQNPIELAQNPIEMVQNPMEMVQYTAIDVAHVPEPSVTTVSTEISEIPKRKRKRKAKSEGVKTSLFEIPEFSNTVTTLIPDNELDHDYSTKSKRQKMSIKPETSAYLANDNISEASNVIITAELADPSVPSTSKVDKQTMRRLKNNVASKRSREQRKQKFVDMDKEAEELVTKNAELREKIVELEKLTTEMKAILVAKMAGK